MSNKSDRYLPPTASIEEKTREYHGILAAADAIHRVRVRLHSNERVAALATDSVIKALVGGRHRLAKTLGGNVSFDADGLATIETTNPAFIKFAVVRQGYVRAIVEVRS